MISKEEKRVTGGGMINIGYAKINEVVCPNCKNYLHGYIAFSGGTILCTSCANNEGYAWYGKKENGQVN